MKWMIFLVNQDTQTCMVLVGGEANKIEPQKENVKFNDSDDS